MQLIKICNNILFLTTQTLSCAVIFFRVSCAKIAVCFISGKCHIVTFAKIDIFIPILNILKYREINTTHSIIHHRNCPHIHRKISADRNIVKKLRNCIHTSCAADSSAISKRVLQTDLRIHITKVIAGFVT